MNTILIAIRLPKEIKLQLSRVCYGLPNVTWLDPDDFLVTIRQLGPLDGSLILDIQEKLELLKAKPFNLNFERLDVETAKGKRGVVRAIVQQNGFLHNLGKEIDSLLAPLKLSKDSQGLDPHVVLGYFEQMQPLKVINYMEAHAGFSSSSFVVVEISLVSIELTTKRLYYFEHKRFMLRTNP